MEKRKGTAEKRAQMLLFSWKRGTLWVVMAVDKRAVQVISTISISLRKVLSRTRLPSAENNWKWEGEAIKWANAGDHTKASTKKKENLHSVRVQEKNSTKNAQWLQKNKKHCQFTQ